MKTICQSHLHGTNGCLGFYQGLDALSADYPEGGLPGEFFINGETQSIWQWDATNSAWCDTNHVTSAPFLGMVDDPATFSPSLGEHEKGCYIYLVEAEGEYEFSLLEGPDTVHVNANSAGFITLEWDGTVWSSRFSSLALAKIPPVALFRGEWNKDKSYQASSEFVDVVGYNGNYYQLNFEGTLSKTDESPDQSTKWDLLPRFSAMANEVELKADGSISIMGDQEIVTFGDSTLGWKICNGNIIHSDEQIRLSQQGDIKVSLGDDDFLYISPAERGLTISVKDKDTGDGRDICKIIQEESGDPLIEVRQKSGDNIFYVAKLKAGAVEVEKEDSAIPTKMTITNNSIMCTGKNRNGSPLDLELSGYRTKVRLKHISDDSLEWGDLYYDDDYHVYFYE